MKFEKNFLFVFALLALLMPANAAFKSLKFGGKISCKNRSTKATLNFIPGAPNGTYNATLKPNVANPYLRIDGAEVPAEGVTKEFKIPGDESKGLKFDVELLEDFLKMEGFEASDIPFTITPGDDLTSQTGFGSAEGSLSVTNDGCGDDSNGSDDEGTSTDELEEGISSVDQPSFVPIDTNTLVSAEQDLMVNFTFKVPAALYDAYVGNLKEGEDINDKLKEIAEKFGVKLDFRKLKKLAKKELKDAGKGLDGEEKEAAIEAARDTGINKLLKEIRLKLPKLPKKGSEDEGSIRKIRKAKKKKILEAVSIEVTDNKLNDDESLRCVTFKLTLPAKVCAQEDGSKALILAGQSIDLMGLEPGETFEVDLDVQVRGLFQKFFGVETAARKRKGKKGPNGKTTMTLTLINSASPES